VSAGFSFCAPVRGSIAILFFDSETLMTTATDALINAADSALRTLFVAPRASRECPTLPERASDHELTESDKHLSGALMRVNHVGEVCAQALYTAQALSARWPGRSALPNLALAAQLEAAGKEETDHLAWTQRRLDELGSRASLLNPRWYAGAFGLGLIAGRMGPAVSLGFVVETERQVEAHLAEHMERLPAGDHASRAIVAQMKQDEARHAREAQGAGAVELPTPVKGLMRLAAKVMTTVAHRI
jgi:ubiquinone biosynthesis monooxygenase Coq7